MMDSRQWSPEIARSEIRANRWVSPTPGLSAGYTQANLVILPEEEAFDFLLFCLRNPKSCPILDVTDSGSPSPPLVAPGADLRSDVPQYRVYRKGKLAEERKDIHTLWENDSVGFLLGCSFTFESALLENDIPVKHIQEERNVPMFETTIACEKAGIFDGPLVVSMRPIPEKDVVRAVQVTSRFPSVHGAPVHIGDPDSIGIRDISKPDFGDAVSILDGEIPVFWACGVTPQAIATQSKMEWMITHAPGHMFITDKRDVEYSIF